MGRLIHAEDKQEAELELSSYELEILWAAVRLLDDTIPSGWKEHYQTDGRGAIIMPSKGLKKELKRAWRAMSALSTDFEETVDCGDKVINVARAIYGR